MNARPEGRKLAVRNILGRLRSLGSRRNVLGMARFGITSRKVFGVGATRLRMLAKKIGRNPELSLRLWNTGYLEARIIAALIGDPVRVTRAQMNRWAKDFDNWAVCDSCCGILFDKTPFAYEKAVFWSKRKKEFVRRAGFVLMAELAVHDKRAPDAAFIRFFPHIRRGATDDRNAVRKAVNWAVRQIGKRNIALHGKAIRLARDIRTIDSRAARWIASDALRELTNPKIRGRIRRSSTRGIGGA
ncbi:MAG TPA: DNA alkylation repair protein [Bacteroidota bacterium]